MFGSITFFVLFLWDMQRWQLERRTTDGPVSHTCCTDAPSFCLRQSYVSFSVSFNRSVQAAGIIFRYSNRVKRNAILFYYFLEIKKTHTSNYFKIPLRFPPASIFFVFDSWWKRTSRNINMSLICITQNNYSNTQTSSG